MHKYTLFFASITQDHGVVTEASVYIDVPGTAVTIVWQHPLVCAIAVIVANKSSSYHAGKHRDVVVVISAIQKGDCIIVRRLFACHRRRRHR